MNQHITLIPEINDLQLTTHHKPIRLCSTLYKIISKILVKMLRSCVDIIISPLQSAFIPRRQIDDDILLAHEIMSQLNNTEGRKPWITLELDMEKTYGRVNWDFIIDCLSQLGFPLRWIFCVQHYILNVSYMSWLMTNLVGSQADYDNVTLLSQKSCIVLIIILIILCTLLRLIYFILYIFFRLVLI